MVSLVDSGFSAAQLCYGTMGWGKHGVVGESQWGARGATWWVKYNRVGEVQWG